MDRLEFASGVKGPWLVAMQGVVEKNDIPEGILLIELDAVSMASIEGLYREFAIAFNFPEYFGNNFNALNDCLTDLDWLPADGYIVAIRNSESLLSEESDDVLEGLLSILERAGAEWATPVKQGEGWDRDGVPFHTILSLSANGSPGLFSRIKRIGLVIKGF